MLHAPMVKSALTAALIAAGVQIFSVGYLAPRLPREVCPPGISDTRDMRLPKVARILLIHRDGAVHVATDTINEVHLTADIRAYIPSRDLRDQATAYLQRLITVRQEEDALAIRTEPEPRPEFIDLQVDYRLLVPKGTAIEIDSTNGNVWVAQGCGSIRVQAVNADVQVDDAMGPVEITTTNGRIRLYEVNHNAVAETVNGNIYAQVRQGSLKAKTALGSITADLMGKEITTCNLTAVNGNVTLSLGLEVAGTIKAETKRGAVRASLDPELGSLLRANSDKFEARLGEGGTQILLQTMNGNITLTRNTA
jgi:hypothetical protein